PCWLLIWRDQSTGYTAFFPFCTPEITIAQATNPPLFINQYGDFYSGKTIDARWGELRNFINIQSGNFEHKFHNLRSTYAVHRLKELLNNQLKEADALDYLQACLGHKHRATLFAYLRFCKQEKSANAIYENALETILEG
nr:hypothetical protein [Vibrio cholerae]